MFDLKRQIKIKQAKNALRDGRIDEALAIAMEKEVREHREGQILLERLVGPFLERAAQHLAAERLKEALLDAERAVVAGGPRAEAVQLRSKIQEALAAAEAARRRNQALVDSAQAHIQNGSLRTGKEILHEVPADAAGAGRLLRQAEQRERKGQEAQARAEAHLQREEIIEALVAAEEASRLSSRQNDLVDLLSRLKKAAVSAMEKFLLNGDLKAAFQLHGSLPPALRESLEARRLEEALAVSREAALAFRSNRFEAAGAALGRLRKILPQAGWVEEGLAAVTRLLENHRLLQTCPLGAFSFPSSPSRTTGRDAPAGADLGETAAAPPPRLQLDARPPGAFRPDHFLLWLDGVGSFLVFTTDRVSLGRLGASARPDVAMASDLAGYHAEILRLDDDYFIVAAQGPVAVNGQPAARKLLADGDVVELGPHCRLTFHLPTALAASAVLTLHKGQRMEGDVRDIVLMNENLLVGNHGACHIPGPKKGEPVVLSLRKGELVCRAREEILIDGKPAGLEAPVEPGAHIQIGDLTFTITATQGGEN
ncbi:MAG: hypothetical protein HY717_00535 [Planctomycetes bacterium]|nr:hypothetical protein [Planctomycetota bacterium]